MLMLRILRMLCLLLVSGLAFAAKADASEAAALIVAYRDEGPAALESCAESLWKSGRPFADALRDHSHSLDLWHERYRTKRVRAIFRRADGQPLRDQSRRLRARLAAAGLAAKAGAPDLAHVYRVEITDPRDVREALETLRDDPHVALAQLDHAYALDQTGFDPNDPFLTSAGSWDQSFADLWALDRIRAPEAWQRTRGAGQLVAVVDTGLDYLHPDIADRVWVNPGEDLDGDGVAEPSDENGRDDDGNGFVDDLRGYDFSGEGDSDPFDEIGHGTHVAGTIAATANNGIGIAGVAPEATVMPLKGFDTSGVGRDSDLWSAVLYAVENGASVINASWSCSPACPDNPLADLVLQLVASAGGVFVTSAGNQGFDVVRSSPERTTLAISVGASGFDDALADFSNRGWLLDLLAPGGGPNQDPQASRMPFVPRRNILSLAASSLDPSESVFRVGEDYLRLAGTSMSAPHVSGAIALLRSARPGLSPGEIRRLLRVSARDVGAPGHDPLHGAGILDLPSLLAEPVPALDLELVEPSPGAILDPLAGPARIRATANGAALVEASLAHARGLDTDDFEEIARADGFDVAAPFEWSVDQLEDGPHVLRLRAVLRDGRRIDEYSIVSFERTEPMRLSRDGIDELSPSISGRNVAWEARPSPTRRSGEVRLGGFAAGSRPREPVALAPGPRVQHSPIASGSRVAWLESEPDELAETLRGCVLSRGRGRACRDQPLVASGDRLGPFRMALGRVLWSPRVDVEFQIEGCRWIGFAAQPKACRPREIESDPGVGGRRLLDFDGRTLVFARNSGGRILEICSPVLRGAPCDSLPVRIEGAPIAADRAALDGDLLVFELDRPGGTLLGHCLLDVATGDCSDPRLIDGVVDARDADVSGQRIVWTELRDGEPSAIYHCQLDRSSGACPRARLAGVHTPASAARIDGPRVVWQDARFGPYQVLGLELPSLAFRARLHPHVGRVAWLPIRARDGRGGTLALAVEAVEGPTPEQWKARLWRAHRDWQVLSFTPRRHDATSRIVWRIRGRASNGLETQRDLEIRPQTGAWRWR